MLGIQSEKMMGKMMAMMWVLLWAQHLDSQKASQ
jgi:hypothetical protein